MKPILRADPFGPGTIDCDTYFGMFANLCFTTSNPNLAGGKLQKYNVG